MIIQLGFYKRKPGLSVAEFRRIWSQVYGPMYARQPELSRHLVRYVQHHLSPIDERTEAVLLFDGFSEAWFDSVDASESLLREPIYLDQIAPLASSFLDIENSKFSVYDSPIYQIGDSPEVLMSSCERRT